MHSASIQFLVIQRFAAIQISIAKISPREAEKGSGGDAAAAHGAGGGAAGAGGRAGPAASRGFALDWAAIVSNLECEDVGHEGGGGGIWKWSTSWMVM